MSHERIGNEPNISPDVAVIGQGNIGEKARQLMEKTPALQAIGFAVPRRTMLTEGFFDGFFQRNHIADNLVEAEADPQTGLQVVGGSFPYEDFTVLQRICESYGSTPLATRSSAEGDARGTGTYTSELVENNIGQVRKALQRVVASYFSESAIAFRRDAQTGEGFGVIIEPVVGQRLQIAYDFSQRKDELFTPLLSGMGYTSTLKGEGYVSAVPGLGGGVDTKEGVKVTKSSLAESDGNLSEYLYTMRRNALEMGTGLDERTKPQLLRHRMYGKAFNPPSERSGEGISYRRMDLYQNDDFRNLNMLGFFDMMSRTEEFFGKPQYFEWALTVENGEPRYWIVQIADVDKNTDQIEFGDHGEVMFMTNTVTGTGIVEIDKIADCWNPSDIEALRRFNAANQDYGLLYSSRLTTAVGWNMIRKLEYADFSNAKVFIEIQDAQHVGDPIAHLGGQLDVTGKLFGVLDFDAEVPPQWGDFMDGKHEQDGINVYEGKLKVVADEKKDVMIVYRTNDSTE